MSETDTTTDRPRHAGAWIGAGATVLAALIAAGFAQNAGVINVIPGSAPTTTVTIPPVTVTAPPVTVTVSAGSDGAPAGIAASGDLPAGAVQLADQSTVDRTVIPGMRRTTYAQNVGINGRTFDHGWVAKTYAGNSDFASIDVNLGRTYTRFRARIGLIDTAPDNTGKVQVFADGKVIFSQEVSLQRSYDVDLPVTGVLRLHIVATVPQKSEDHYGFGEPLLVP